MLSKGQKPYSSKYSKKKSTTKKDTVQKVQIEKKQFKATVKRGMFRNREYAMLRYVDNGNLQSAVTQYRTGSILGYMLNGINTPNIAQIVGDHLPQGYACYNGIFGQAKVKKCKVKLEIAPNTTGKQLQLVVALNNAQDLASNIYPVPNQTADFSGTSQRRNVWTYPLPVDKKFTFNRFIKIADLQSISKSQFDNNIDDFTTVMTTVLGALGSVPAKRCDIRFGIINNTDGTAVDLPYEIETHYYTEFFDRTREPFVVST